MTFLFGILSRQHFLKGIFWQELTCKIVARPSFPVVNATFLFLWHSFPQTFPPTQSLLATLLFCFTFFVVGALNRVGLAGSWQPLGLGGPHGRRRLNAWTSWRHYGPTPPSISDSTQSIENVEKSFASMTSGWPLCFWQLETSQRAALSSHHPSSPRKRFSAR